MSRFKHLLPHVIAVGIFLLVTLIYCKPALQGLGLEQNDVTQWKGAFHESELFRDKNGVLPLWVNSVFSGMPAFPIGYQHNNLIGNYVQMILTLGLPVPFQFFFLACICMYFLLQILNTRVAVSILGALAFAYSTYNVVIIGVGHDTKMWSMAYMPALLGAIIMIYQGRYMLGAALTGLLTSTMLSMNHPQIDYYFFIIAVMMTLSFIIVQIKEKNLRHLALSLAFVMAGALVGVATNAVNILSTYEFHKETIRGGQSELAEAPKGESKKQTGLDKDYAFSYSMFRTEPLVMMFPRMYGGSTSYPSIIGGKGFPEMDEADSKAVEQLQAMPPELGNQIANTATLYWGGIGATSGPPYLGAVVCFLAILSIFTVDKRYTIWIFATVILSIMISWGSYFSGFNTILYEKLPMFNKFRAPSMILVIPQLLLNMLAALSLQAIIFSDDHSRFKTQFRKGLIATGVLFGFVLLLYFSFTFLSEQDKEIIKQVRNLNQPQLSSTVNTYFDALKEDRKGLMMGDIIRALVLIAATVAVVWMAVKKTLKPILAVSLVGLLAIGDLLYIDSNYFNASNFVEKPDADVLLVKNQNDEKILSDKGFFRVFNLAGGSAFNENYTSYFFNSVGGYTAVKLRAYQDIIEKRLGVEQNQLIQALQKQQSLDSVHTPTLNMLNTRYFIYREGSENKGVWQNANALGNAWFVYDLKKAAGPKEMMDALAVINPGQTAVVMETDAAKAGAGLAPDSSATITLEQNNNDVVKYRSNASTAGFAVFSEVFYRAGWKASIDGTPADIIRTNYILRGLNIPAGKHEIVFEFRPEQYWKGHSITAFANILLILFVLGGLYAEWKTKKRK